VRPQPLLLCPKLPRHHLADLKHNPSQLILTPARNPPRPLEVGCDLIPQGPDFFGLEGTGVRQDRCGVIQGVCDAPAPLGSLSKWSYLGVFGGLQTPSVPAASRHTPPSGELGSIQPAWVDHDPRRGA